MTRFVIDCQTLLQIAAGEVEVAAEHQLVAPTLVRSQALAALYEAARRGEISAAQGVERMTRINSLKVRFLGDKVLQRQAWKVADELGWETTYDAEYVALTKLQADAFVTSNRDIARAVSGLVETATVDALRTSCRHVANRPSMQGGRSRAGPAGGSGAPGRRITPGPASAHADA
jgi:predicted nucleic acid-binding protein